MTTIIGWVKEREKRGLLISDDKLSTVSRHTFEKIHLIYGRWAVGVYGSSLLKMLLEDLSYFNDKMNRPSIDDIHGLLSNLSELSRITLPVRIDWLRKTSIGKELERVITSPSGFAILDCKSSTLHRVDFRSAMDIQKSIDDVEVEQLSNDLIWYFGFNHKNNERLYSDLGGEDAFTVGHAKAQLELISRLHPNAVGKPSCFVSVEEGHISFQSAFSSLDEFAKNQVVDEPFYIDRPELGNQ